MSVLIGPEYIARLRDVSQSYLPDTSLTPTDLSTAGIEDDMSAVPLINPRLPVSGVWLDGQVGGGGSCDSCATLRATGNGEPPVGTNGGAPGWMPGFREPVAADMPATKEASFTARIGEQLKTVDPLVLLIIGLLIGSVIVGR